MTSNRNIIRDIKNARNDMHEKRKLYIESKEILECFKSILEEVKQENIEKNKLNDILNSLLLFNINSIIMPKLDINMLKAAIHRLEELNSKAKSHIRPIADAEENVQKQEKVCKTVLYDYSIAIEHYIYNYKRFMNKFERIKSEYNDMLLLQDNVHRNSIYESEYANSISEFIIRKIEHHHELLNEMTDTYNMIKSDLHDLINDSIISDLNNDIYNRIRNSIETTVTNNICDINNNVNDNINIINNDINNINYINDRIDNNINNNINIINSINDINNNINDNINTINNVNNDINTFKENIRIRNTTETNTNNDSINSNVKQNRIDKKIVEICNDLTNHRNSMCYGYVCNIKRKP